MVLRSTFRYDSIHGSTKKIPGPLDPPCRRRPSRNITALSYSCTTLKQTQREKGSVTRTRPHEIIVRSRPHRPTPLSDSSVVQSGTRDISSLPRPIVVSQQPSPEPA